jgi:actin-related protein
LTLFTTRQANETLSVTRSIPAFLHKSQQFFVLTIQKAKILMQFRRSFRSAEVREILCSLVGILGCNHFRREVSALHSNEDLLAHIVPIGGTTLIEGLTDELKTRLAQVTSSQLNVVEGHDQNTISWLGSPVFASEYFL